MPSALQSTMPGPSTLLSLVLLLHLQILHLSLLSAAQPDAYMDEIFHIPQVQKYCAGNYDEWDPKITTPPGLYLTAVALVAGPLRWWPQIAKRAGGTLEPPSYGLPPPTACQSPAALRAVNCILGLMVFVELRGLLARRGCLKPDWMALAGCLFPLHFFFTGVFYTDVGSLLFVLRAYSLADQGRPLLCGLVSVVAIFFRQTNAVWVAFILGQTILGILDPATRPVPGARAKPPLGLDPRSLLSLLARLRTLAGPIAAQTWPLAAVLLGFAAFVRANGAIVLGDKTAHEASFHLMQLPYFALFAALSLWPLLLDPKRARAHARFLLSLRGLAAFAAVTGAVAFAARRYTLAHIYLLSDNRHYTFYLWRRILGKAAFQRSLVPLYAACFILMWREIEARRGPIWALGYFLAVGLAVVPAKLLELRYSTVPIFTLLLVLVEPVPARAVHGAARRLSGDGVVPADMDGRGKEEAGAEGSGVAGGAVERGPEHRQWWVCTAILGSQYLLVDALATWAFVFRPFEAPDGSVGRFIW